MIGRPGPTEYGEFHKSYLARVPEDDILSVLQSQRQETHHFLTGIPREKASYRYAEGKWSVREIVGHLIDAERILGYRALAIARGETQNLPGFEEAEYVEKASFESVPMEELIEELDALRHSEVLFFRHLAPEAWLRQGTANGIGQTARGLAYIIAGHQRHHLAVLREKYGISG